MNSQKERSSSQYWISQHSRPVIFLILTMGFLGAYLAFFAYTALGIHPYVFAPIAALVLFGLGYVIQSSGVDFNSILGSSRPP